jgi:bifunctional non-homologous end joining protein LigD
LLKGVRDPIRLSASLSGDPRELLELARQQQIEGLIGKRADSQYEAGRRSGSWIKLKVTQEQEFVIGGYTEPKGSRRYFGALLLGYYEMDQLMYVSHVGTGFDTKTLAQLHKLFQKFRTDQVPFANVPSRRAGRFGGGLTNAEMRRCTWLRPELVAQVRFTEWTDEGGLRHPVFLGLRDDKPAREVIRERPA